MYTSNQQRPRSFSARSAIILSGAGQRNMSRESMYLVCICCLEVRVVRLLCGARLRKPDETTPCDGAKQTAPHCLLFSALKCHMTIRIASHLFNRPSPHFRDPSLSILHLNTHQTLPSQPHIYTSPQPHISPASLMILDMDRILVPSPHHKQRIRSAPFHPSGAASARKGRSSVGPPRGGGCACQEFKLTSLHL